MCYRDFDEYPNREPNLDNYFDPPDGGTSELYPNFNWLKSLAAAVLDAHGNDLKDPALILAARYLDANDPNVPDWVRILAGGNPEEMRAVIDTVFELGDFEEEGH